MFRNLLQLPLAILLALVTTGSHGADLPSERDRWIELATQNFTFFSNAGERATRHVALDLEELRAVLTEISDLDDSSPLPIYVYVFKNDRAFTPYKMLYRGRPAATTGYFLQRDHANYIAIDGGSHTDASAIVYHEFVHYYSATNLPEMPVWFEEGLAELYQTFEADATTARIGIPIDHHLLRLKTSPIMPLDQLFAVDHASPDYNEEDRKGAFYAQSWALVHYLMIGSEQRRAETRRFIGWLQEGVGVDDAFNRAYSTDPAGLQPEFRRYLDRTMYPYLQVAVSPKVETSNTVKRMTHAEVLFRLGDLLAQQVPPRPEVESYLAAAVQHDPSQSEALASLGRLAEDRARWVEAHDFYSRALDAGPNDPLVLYRAGAYFLRRGGDFVRARSALQTSVTLWPDYAPAWVALTGSYMATGEHSIEALEAAKTAHRLLPSRSDVTSNLVRLYLANDQRENAVAVAQRSFSANPSDLRTAYGIIARSDLDRARRHVADGQPDQAMEALTEAEWAASQALDREMLDRHIASTRSNIVEQRVTARYNEAVAAFNSGDVAAARTVLVELANQDLPGRHADAVDSFLAYIDNPDSGPQFPPPQQHPTEASPGEIDRLNELITLGQFDEAVEILVNLKARGAQGERSWIDVKIEEIRRAIDHNRFVETFNRAVDQFNGGAFAAAIATLEELLSTQPDAPEADRARSLLVEARQQLEE